MANNLLEGKRGIIFGALNSQSIAWHVAEKAHEQGARFVLTNAPIAMRMGEINGLAEKTGSKVIPADATSVEDLEKLISESMEILGGKIDFILHSIGMSVNVRKGNHYTDENYDYTMKGLDVSALSFHKVMQTAKKLDAMSEWGSIVALTYIAAQRVFPDYNDMADNKAYLESIARSFGYHFGVDKKVRVNTISQSPTMTTDASACADYCITLFSDLTRYVTMQNLFHDGGFSNSGVTQQVIERFSEQ
jgi:enoyl-[acyl-carrier protein] reductase I